MTKYKVKWGFWFVCFICFLILFAIPKVIGMLMNGEIAFDDGEIISGTIRTLMIVMFSIVWLLYLPTVFAIIKIVFVYKCKPFEITPAGIENTFICVPIFCIMVVRTVKLIPWECVKIINADNGTIYFRLRVKNLKCGLIAKLYLFIVGYAFCAGIAGPKLSEADQNLCMIHSKNYAKIL